MYINNTWELIGTTTIDLSDYVTETELTTALTPYVQTSALTPTLDDRYVNVTGDTMSGKLSVELTANAAGLQVINSGSSGGTLSVFSDLIRFTNTNYTPYKNAQIKLLNYSSGNQLEVTQGNTSAQLLKTPIPIVGVTVPPETYSNKFSIKDYVASVRYVDDQVSAITSSIPSITATAGLTTGVAIGNIDINGTTTTLYAPAAVTPPAYSLSMSGATITLLADNVAASTITLPIYDGTIQ